MTIEVTRVSLSPFDMRVRLREPPETECDAVGLPTIQQPWIERLVGEPLSAYSSTQDHIVTLTSQGFGLNLRRATCRLGALTDHNALAELLLERAEHHRTLRDGIHPDAELLKRLKDVLVTSSATHPHPAHLRPDLWPAPPYTLSFFYLPHAAHDVLDCDDAVRGLYALLEPSQVMRSELLNHDDPLSVCVDLIASINVDRLKDRYHDADIRAGSAAFCSWAGMVVCDGHCTDLAYFESLEVRLQLAWLKATFARRWAETLLLQPGLGEKQLAQFASDVSPILRQSRRLIDATVSTRDQELFDELLESSALVREMSGAEEAVGDVRERLDQAHEASRQRYDRTIEGLLVLLAVLQIVPLFYTTPFTKLEPWSLIPVVVILGAFLLIRGRRM